MGCDEATYIAATIIIAEVVHRAAYGGPFVWDFPASKNIVFVSFFVLSMLSTVLFVWRFHSWSIFKNRSVQQFLPFLYMIDSIGALYLGHSLYYEHTTGVVISMTLLTNFLMLHILHGVFSGKGHNDMVRDHRITLNFVFGILF